MEVLSLGASALGRKGRGWCCRGWWLEREIGREEGSNGRFCVGCSCLCVKEGGREADVVVGCWW